MMSLNILRKYFKVMNFKNKNKHLLGKRECITHVTEYIRPGGGPAGYVYYLKSGIEGRELGKVEFIYSKEYKDDFHDLRNIKVSFLKKLPKFLTHLIVFFLILRDLFFKVLKLYSYEDIRRLLSSKVLVFHDSFVLSSYLFLGLKPKDQKIFLIPHSPTNLVNEKIDNCIGFYGYSLFSKFSKKILGLLEYISYKKLDGLILPCIFSIENYFPDIKSRKKLLEVKIIELPTGIKKPLINMAKNEVFQKYNLPKNKKIIGYFGRYHHHKGFDIYCEIAKMAKEREISNFVFLSAGFGYIIPPNIDNFVDLGLVSNKDVYNIMNIVDIVVIPNRIAFFDLVFLEALSLGKIIVASKVGGHKCFQAPGVFILNSFEPFDFLNMITKIFSEYNYEALSRENIKYFENNFSLDKFIQRHLDFANNILKE